MNTPGLVSRIETNALPQWGAQSPGYLAMNSGGGGEEAQGRSNLHFGAVFKKYWWAALLVWLAIAVPASVLIYKNIDPQYLATAAINVAPTVVNPATGQGQTNAFYSEYLHTQALMVKSAGTLRDAAEDIRLRNFPWFTKLPDQVGYLSEHVNVEPAGGTQDILITMTHRDAAAATAIVNSVLEAYRKAREGMDNTSMAESLHIVQGLQKTTQDNLDSAKRQLAEFSNGGNMPWSEQDQKVLITVISDAKQTLGRLQSDQLKLQATLDDIKERKMEDEQQFIATVPTDGDPQINQWMQEQIRVQMLDSVLASKGATLDHPDRKEYRKQLKVLDGKLAGRRKEIQQNALAMKKADFELHRTERINDTTADLAAVNQQITSLTQRIEEQEKSAKELGSRSQPILAVKEQITDDKEALKRYDDRIQEIQMLNMAPGKVTAIDAVEPKTATIDKRKTYILEANGAGLFLGMALLVLLMKLRDKIDNAEDLRDTYQPLVVGSVSHAGIAARGMSGKMGRKILGEEMRLLHANLLPPGRTEQRVMMITSPTPSNGKTSIASQLALSLAKSGLEVLLIDADLRKRDLSTMFDVGFRPGLADLLQGNMPELIRPVELLPNLRLMGAGSRLERNPVELFQRKHFHESLAMLQEKFDCIVVDTPPILVVADARLMATSCDEILCVVRAQVTSPKEVDQAVEALTRITGKSPKIVVNGVAHRQSYYKYKFAYTSDVAGDENGAADNLGKIEA